MSARVIIDMRCLQDPNYAERGIGRHTRNVLAHAPVPFIGVFDPHLPPLPADMAALAAELSPHGYLPRDGGVFLNPSPMSPNQNFVARPLLDERLTKAALVYDFIPYDDQANYLADPVTRLDYLASMAWLRRYDLFFPISEDTAARLRALYGKPPGLVTGVALPDWAMAITPAAPSHILMVGGGDARKNPEILLRAHAASPILRKIPLVITGHYTAATIENYRAITAVELPGRVTDEDMRALYGAAICVVTPSRAEGFSLPVIEAAAAKTPAIVSDIPAHRALIPDETCRFAPDDEAALTRILDSIVQNPARREAIIAAQSGLAAAFTPAAIAAKIWRALLPPAPAIARRAKPRIALISPLPPDKSGVADYSMALAAALRARAAVTLCPGPHTAPLPYLSGKFDRVVAAIGNGPLHADIHALATRHGAAVICHDHRLLGLATHQGLAAAAAWASQELGRKVSEAEITDWAADENTRAASFLGPLAGTARPLIFHAQAPVALVRQRFGATARHLPFAIYRPFAGAITPERRAAARAALGYAPGQKIIASFGFITPHKGLAVLLRAFARLPETARLVLVGEISAEASALASRASELGITARVTLGAGYMPEAQYRAHLLAADVAIQLREGGPGNISGALQDCIAAGLPSVANTDLAENLSAPSYVTRISDALDEAEIAAALQAAGPQDTEAERAAYGAAFSMDRYADALLRVLEL